MKSIKKQLFLFTLLYAGFTPQETHTIPSCHPLFLAHIGAQFLLPITIVCSLGYFPYLFITRHNEVQNFVRKQTDVETYAVDVMQTDGKQKTKLATFLNDDYKILIKQTVNYLQTSDTIKNIPQIMYKKRGGKKLSALFLQPSVTLKHDSETYQLHPVSVSILKEKPQDFSKVTQDLVNTFRVPRIQKRSSFLPYALATIAVPYLFSFFGPVGLLFPLVLVAGPSLSNRHKNAQDFVDRQEDIEQYAVTVKIKRHTKTVLQETFHGVDPKTVINEALLYAHQHQTVGLRSVFKTSVTLYGDKTNYNLTPIIKRSLPAKATKQSLYWKKVACSLQDRLIIPEATDQESKTTYVNRMGYFGLESGALVCSPYVAALPLLLL